VPGKRAQGTCELVPHGGTRYENRKEGDQLTGQGLVHSERREKCSTGGQHAITECVVNNGFHRQTRQFGKWRRKDGRNETTKNNKNVD
jgi:hypothetical protein